MNLTPIQREARIRHKAATAYRRVVEEAVCESLLADDWDAIERARLRVAAGEARLREAVAEVQAKQLGVSAA